MAVTPQQGGPGYPGNKQGGHYIVVPDGSGTKTIWVPDAPGNPPAPAGAAQKRPTTTNGGIPSSAPIVNPKHYNVNDIPGADSLNSTAGYIQGTATDAANSAIGDLSHNLTTPDVNISSNVQGPNLPAPVQTNTSASSAAFDRASGGFQNSTNDRGQTNDYIYTLNQGAQGNGPSTAGAMVQDATTQAASDVLKNSNDAATQYSQAGNDALSAYGNAANAAAAAYAASSGDQRAAFEQAAMNASQQTRQAAEDAVRAGGALTSMARGGQMGAALLNAQSNATGLVQQANQQASANQQANNLAASQQAAAAQRQASANQVAANQGAIDAQSRTDTAVYGNKTSADIQAELIRMKGIIEAGRQLSTDQMHYIDQLGITLKDLRTMDQGDIDRAIALGGLGTSIDTMINDTNNKNADRAVTGAGMDIGVNEFNTSTNVGIASGNANRAVNVYGINTARATAVLNTSAGREAMALAVNGQYTALAAQLGMSEDELRAKLYMAAQQTGVQKKGQDRAFWSNVVGSVVQGTALVLSKVL